MHPLDIIEPLRESDEYIKSIFMQGSCFRFYRFLKHVFKDAEPRMSVDRDHVVTLIDGKMYDIKGQVDEEQEPNYLPFTRQDWITVQGWSFAAHNLISIEECKFCGEPFTISVY